MLPLLRSKFHHIYWPLVPLLLLGIITLACNGTGLATNNDAMKKISQWTIYTWMIPRPNQPVSLVIKENQGVRELFLRYGKEERYIASMTRPFGQDIPIEAQFVNIDGTRFVVFFVPEPDRAHTRSLSILFYGLDPLYPNQPALSTEVKIVGLDKDGMGVIPIYPAEADIWSHVTSIILTSHDLDRNLVEKVFDPPLPIADRFIQISLPGN